METSQLQTADYVVITGYFALMLVVGFYFKRFMVQARDFFTGANEVPWWLAGVSFYMTTFSAFAFVAYGEVAYLYGWAAVTLMWMSIPACLVAGYWIAPLWRRARVSTPIEFLETRYNSIFRQLFAWSGFPLRIADNGLRLYSLGIFLSVAVGMDIRWSIIVSSVVLLAYTFLGGLWAVAVTDFVQGVVLFAALFIILPLSISRGGGFAGLMENYPGEGYLHLANGPYSWLYLLSFGVLVMLNYNAGWAMVQRFYSVKNEKEARKVGLTAAVLNVIGPPLFFLPVMLSRHLLTDLENTRYAYASMALELLPVGMMGIMITAMFSATMSTLSAEYNVLASVATTDIYKRVFKPHADERRLLTVGRVFTAVIALITTGIAIIVTYYPNTPLFSIMVTVFGVAVAPMMLPLLGGLIFRKLTLRGAIVGFIVGLISGFTMLMLQKYYLPGRPGIDPEWITFDFGAISIFVNVGVSALAMFLWTLFERRDPAEVARIEHFFERMDTPIEATGELKAGRKVPSPFFITGMVTAGIGVMLLGVTVVTPTTTGRVINLIAGTILCLVGWLLYRTKEKLPAEIEQQDEIAA